MTPDPMTPELQACVSAVAVWDDELDAGWQLVIGYSAADGPYLVLYNLDAQVDKIIWPLDAENGTWQRDDTTYDSVEAVIDDLARTTER